jgi:hypothetical protein
VSQAGDSAEALRRLRRSYGGLCQEFGEEHPDTLRVGNSLIRKSNPCGR